MYIGILDHNIQINKKINEIYVDLNCSISANQINEIQIHSENPKEFRKSLGFALENIWEHGSATCSFEYGFDKHNNYIIKITDKQGGFDPSTIKQYKNFGLGYKEFSTSETVKVGFSSDGKITYLITKYI